MIVSADVVVIGGGCMGASTAYHLARRGVKRVALVEKGYLASGPTGKSSAIVRQHYTLKELVITSLKSLRVFESFDEIVGGDPGFVRTGFVFLAQEADREELEGHVAMQRAVGVNVQVLSRDEIQELQPQADLDGVDFALYHPETGYANPAATTSLFASAARDLGVQVYEETVVTDVRLDGDRVVAVVTDKGEISTPLVVNAAGAWGDRVGRMVGVDLPISPTRHQICIVKRPYDFWQPQMIFVDFPVKTYYRPEGTDLYLIGAAGDRFDHDRADPDSYDEDVDHESMSWLMARLQRRFPVMARASYRGGYSGIYDITPDHQPIIGPVSGLTGFFCILGWSGHGFKHSPVMGDLMAELITEGDTAEVDLTIFRLDRFREGKLLQSGPI